MSAGKDSHYLRGIISVEGHKQMKKKIDKAHQLFQDNIYLFRCPLCQANFIKTKQPRLECANGHNFDLARNGYCNLLTSSAKSTYERDTFRARRDVFQAGLFTPLIDSLSGMFRERVLKNPLILDAGCGEGSLAVGLYEKIIKTKPIVLGVDIAKKAVQLAGGFNLPIMWCVADLAELPIIDSSLDVIFNVLSPANYSEFQRILKPNGMLVKVVPGEKHLQEIRTLLGDAYPGDASRGDDSSYSNQAVLGHFKQNVTVRAHRQLCYKVEIPKQLWPQVVTMTPLSKHKVLKGTSAQEITVSLEILQGTFNGRDI